MNRTAPTKLVIAIVQTDDAADLSERLIEAGFGVTRIDAAGGFMRRQNAAVFTATDEESVPTLLETVRRGCRRRMVAWFPPMPEGMLHLPTEPIDVEVGGAVVFVVPIERVEFLSEADPPTSRAGAASEGGRREAAVIGR